jgi:hypothetical protein
MTNNKIVLASIVVIVAAGLLALNPSMIGNAQEQMYDNNYYQDDNRYSFDKKESKSSHVDIQKIKCVNSNINVNGVDITQIPQDDTATAAANEEAAAVDATNTQNGKGLADRINFDRNLVNICVNVNDNEQLKVQEGPQSTTTTLRVTLEVVCQDNTGSTANLCSQVNGPTGLITEDQYNMRVQGNNPVPSEFLGSEAVTVVKLDPGDYRIFSSGSRSVADDIITLNNANPGFTFLLGEPNEKASGDCDIFGRGTIASGESQTCDFQEQIIIELDR